MNELVNNVFISHSSKDIEFILQLNDFLFGLGISKDNIFCSSIEGQGVKQGNRIEDEVKKHLSNSTVIIYVLSQSFLQSQACMQELGVGWMDNDSKKCFYIKLDDITMDEIKGFINTSYKFTFITEESLSEFIDDFCEITKLPSRKASETLKLIKSLVNKSSTFIEKIVDEKKLSDEEKNKKVLGKLHESIAKLNLGEMKVVSSLYFSEDQCGSFEITSGVINLLSDKRIVYRLTQVSSFGMYFQYTLQPWVKEYIDNNDEFKKKLQMLYQGPSRSPNPFY
jgi:hypothetical protein